MNEFHLRLVHSCMRAADVSGNRFLAEKLGLPLEESELYGEAIIEEFRGQKQTFRMAHHDEPGYGPGGCRTDDVVFIILGLNTPFLLRADESAGEKGGITGWRLVGECFVYNLMKGQGLEGGAVEEIMII